MHIIEQALAFFFFFVPTLIISRIPLRTLAIPRHGISSAGIGSKLHYLTAVVEITPGG